MDRAVTNTALVMTLVLLFASPSMNFSIQKRSPRDSYVQNTLKALHRVRRHADQQRYLGSRLRDTRIYPPYAEYNDLDTYNGLDSRPDKYEMAELLRRYPSLAYSAEEYDPGSFDTQRTPSLKELNDIFGNLESNGDVMRHKEGDDNTVSISKSKMEQLLKKVEKGESEETTSDTDDELQEENEGTPEPVPVTKEELDKIFDDNEKNNGNEEKQEDKKSSELKEKSDKNEEKIIRNENDKFKVGEKVPSMNTLPNEKKKRVTKRDSSSKNSMIAKIPELLDEIERRGDEITRLKFVEFLEDKENDYLALALKDATLAQLRGDTDFLKTEYGDIQNAINIEELLQDFKTQNTAQEEVEEAEKELSDELQAEEEEEQKEYEKSNLENVLERAQLLNDNIPEIKRQEPRKRKPMTDEGIGRWYDKPMPVQGEEAPDRFIIDGDTVSKDEADNILQNFVNKYIRKSDGENDIDNAELPREEEVIPDENDVRGAISDYLINLRQPLQKRLTGTCPVVEQYHTDCGGLTMDKEAKELCRRHGMCYKCGSSLGMEKETCDAGFRSEVINACGDNRECIKDGAHFLWYIQADHKYNYRFEDECSDPCVEDYIVGLWF